MDRQIDTELNALNEKLLHMARLAEESVALAVKFTDPAAAGVPDRTPFEFKVIPAGGDPCTMLKV